MSMDGYVHVPSTFVRYQTYGYCKEYVCVILHTTDHDYGETAVRPCHEM